MTEIGLFSTNVSNTVPSIGGLLEDKIAEGLSYTISRHLNTTGLSPNQFDLVLSHFSFHEFTDPAAVLCEMARVTKNGGAILIQDWERPVGWRMPLALLSGKLFYLFSPPMRRQAIDSIQAAYTAQELDTFLQKSLLTFEITSFWYSFCKLIKVIAIRP